MNEGNFADFVPHPRFGQHPIRSDEEVPVEQYASHWRYSRARYFSDTAIWSDPERQRVSVSPLLAYADVRKTCRSCARPFLFFALEQRHWYEELGLPIEADCVDCTECRKENRKTRAIQQRQQELFARQAELDDTGWLELAETYAELFKRRIVKSPQKANWALNRIQQPMDFAVAMERVRSLIASRPI